MDTTNQVYNLFTKCKAIKNTSSTNDKKQLLKSFESDTDLLNLFKFLYDPLIVTGISNSKLTKVLDKSPKNIFSLNDFTTTNFDNLFDLLNYLKINNTGRDCDIKICQAFLDRFIYDELIENIPTDSYDIYDFVFEIITKSLKLGIDYKLINSVYGPDFIHIHEVQQAVSREKLKLAPNEWFCISHKLNGTRGTYINGEILSRQGKAFTGIDHIVSALNYLNHQYKLTHNYSDLVFDGEIIRKNTDNLSDNENFVLGTGILNSEDKDKSCLEFVIFDVLPLSEFMQGKSKLTYKQRLQEMYRIKNTITNISLLNSSLKVVDFLYEGTDQSKIDYWIDEMTNRGYEGVMIAKDVPYYCKRHTGLVKGKKFHFVDLEIIGYEVGEGKYKNMLGAFIVNYKGNEVNVGSGLTDEDRKYFWDIKDDLIGRIIEVKYKDITKDKDTQKESLQFPIYIRLREPGKTVSYD